MARPSRSTIRARRPVSTTGPDNSSTSADNPVAILDLAEEKAETYRAIGNMQTEYRLPWVEGLRANVNLGFDVSDGKRRNFTPSVLHRELATGRGGSRPGPTRADQHGARDLPQLHHAAPGRSGHPRPDRRLLLDQTHIDSLYYEGNGLSTRRLAAPSSIVPAANATNIEFEQESKLISFFGRVNYNINDRYIARGEPAPRRLVAVRRGERVGHVPVGVGRRGGCRRSRSCAGSRGCPTSSSGAPGPRPATRRSGTTWQYSSYQLGDNQTQYQFGDTVFTTIRPSAVDPNIKWEQTQAGQRRPRLRVRQSADHRRHRLVRQEDRRPDLQRAGGGGHQPVELRHHQHRQHAEPGSS